MMHSFDTDHAERYGIPEAILIHHFTFWLTKNRANRKHQHEGRTWTYNSVRAFAELFSYLSEKQIRRALDHLVDEEVIQTGNYNRSRMDRTRWIAFVDEDAYLPPICPPGQMDLPEEANATAQEGRPIPDSKPDSKPDAIDTVGNPDEGPPYAEIVADLNAKAGTRYRASSKKTRALIRARFAEGYTAGDFKTVHARQVAAWSGTHMAKYLRPETLYSPKFESYLHAPDAPTAPRDRADQNRNRPSDTYRDNAHAALAALRAGA